jgi:glycosyltransferase 2 family protein
VSLGILFIPSPAGAGIREVVLVLALAPILDSGQALAIVVASRVILIVCDLAFALVALVSGRLVDDGVGV